MIVVIADDFTGAAELGGIGLRYNLSVEINTVVNLESTADLLIIATDTRSLKKEDAVATMESITKDVALLKPELIYKKVDSVLRGHIIAELKAHLQGLGLKKVLLAPANPALYRLIIDGVYYVGGHPLHLTPFAHDPDFPARSSFVFDILDDKRLRLIQKQQALEPEGIMIADTRLEADLKDLAEHVNKDLLMAGGSGFFRAILEQMGYRATEVSQKQDVSLSTAALLVCGTAFQKSVDAVKKMWKAGGLVSYIPAPLLATDDENLYTDWCGEIASFIKESGKALIAVDAALTRDKPVAPAVIREKISGIVAKVLAQTKVSELLIEGGSTTFAVLKKLNISELYPVEELAPGVIRMQIKGNHDMHITIKPGSYNWPKPIEETLLT